MASPMIMNTVTTSSNQVHNRRKKKQKNKQPQAATQPNGSTLAEWKSEAKQQAYSSKLLQALRQVRLNNNSSLSRPRAVREAADQALAITAKGKTRWSRAILTNRLKLKFMKSKRARVGRVPPNPGSSSRTKKPKVGILRLKARNLPAVQRKVKVLGRLVPGCRKEAFPVILEEATDYIVALEMQVRVMSALAELLSGSSAQSQLGSTS